MKAQSLRGRRTFEMRASSCEEHIQRRVLPQPRRPYVLRWAGSAQKVYHGVRVGQPGSCGRHRAPAPPGACDGAQLAGTGGAAGRRRAGGDALLGVVARSADGGRVPGGGGSPAAGEADLSCALQDGPRGCPQVGRLAAHGSPPGDLDPRCRDAGAADAVAGVVPGTRSSGGKTAHGSVGPAGSAWLKWLFVEAVQTLKRQPGPVRSQYERLLRAKGKQKATVAAARKLCCYVYWMMKEGRSYDDWLRQRHQREVRPIQAVASVA